MDAGGRATQEAKAETFIGQPYAGTIQGGGFTH